MQKQFLLGYTSLRSLVLIASVSLTMTADAQSFRKLDKIGNNYFSNAYQISDNGRYATGTISGLASSVVRWDMSAQTTYWGNPTTFQTTGLAGGMSADGQLVAGTFGIETSPFVYDYDAAFKTTGTVNHIPDIANSNQSFASDVSATGDRIIGYAMKPSQGSLAANTVIRYNTTTQSLEDLGFFGPPGTAAWIRCDATGDTIVGAGTGLSSYWTQSTGWVDIPGLASYGYEVSDSGRYIVGSSQFSGGGPRGMIYDRISGTMTDLGTLGGAADMYAVTDQLVAVGTSNDFTTNRAVWWRPGVGLRDLNAEFASVIPTGWHLWEARDITPDGRYILGTGRNEFGSFQAFVIDTVPEPISGIAVALGLAIVSRRRRTTASAKE